MTDSIVRGPRISKIRKDANPMSDRCPACLSASIERRGRRIKCNHCTHWFMPYEAVRITRSEPQKTEWKGDKVPSRSVPEFRPLTLSTYDNTQHWRLAMMTRR